MSLSQSFARFGATPLGRQSWSALSADRKTVVVTMWNDLIEKADLSYVYDTFTHADRQKWIKSPGNLERRNALRWAMRNCGGNVRAVVIVAEYPKVYPRSVLYSQPDERVWSVDHFDEN